MCELTVKAGILSREHELSLAKGEGGLPIRVLRTMRASLALSLGESLIIDKYHRLFDEYVLASTTIVNHLTS